MNVRNDVYTLLEGLPHNVYHTRLDPFKSDKYPVISVQTVSDNRKVVSSDYWTKVDTTLSIVVANVTTVENFDTVLDDIVEEVRNRVFTDQDWRANFEQVTNIDTKFGYMDAGETDLATAVMTFTVCYSEQIGIDESRLVPLERIGVSVDHVGGDLSTYNPQKLLESVFNPYEIDPSFSTAIETLTEFEEIAKPYTPTDPTPDGEFEITSVIELEQP